MDTFFNTTTVGIVLGHIHFTIELQFIFMPSWKYQIYKFKCWYFLFNFKLANEMQYALVKL